VGHDDPGSEMQGVFSSLEIHSSARGKTLQRIVVLFVCLW